MSEPSIAIAEAFKQFSQATVSAFRAYEQGTRARLNQVEDDLHALRRERDDALTDLNANKEQTRVWLAEVDKWKAEVDRASAVSAHQAELVVQLRQEAQQWKDQCLRLEEILRGEIKSWKDQFLRIDAEHARLLHQLSAPSSQATLAHTPRHVPDLAGDSTAISPPTKRASASSFIARIDRLSPRPLEKASLPRVLRRVQAVIEVPVKEEEREEDFEPDIEHLDPVPQPRSTSTGGNSGRYESGAGLYQQQSSQVTRLEEGYGVDEEESPSDGVRSGSEYVHERVENAIANPTASRRTVPWGRKYIRHEPDEEDDELMMYAKDNPRKVQISHKIRLPPLMRTKSLTDIAASRESASTPKRRTMEAGPESLARVKRRR
ncbi:hypothetical protein B0F90DRAFT_1815794 [Multifurca ochricompacta]|uniref:Uncharacterized protein n=1 Tax=Multifurca ochricompacta TaxID=376703 RepID=A0AAD4M829_9AGAM|nr:hypothetical protein B0F90DRAFT_1815794 [Multifurca ochricompacta]